MTIQRPDFLPRIETGLTGLLHLGTIVAGVTSMLSGSAMILLDDAAATVGHILAAEPLYRLGVEAEVLGGVLCIAVTALLKGLLKPVNRTVSLAAVACGAAGCAVGAVAMTVPMDNPASFVGFAPGELQAMVLLAIERHGQAYVVGMLFFGAVCAMLGQLTLRSTFAPNSSWGLSPALDRR
jgi:hypothetical protein